MQFTDVLLRLGVAAALGAFLGFERELRGQAAGLRTHILVALGACLFTLAGANGFQAIPGEGIQRMDLTRVASQVVVGIGFLGGGAILRHGNSIRGLTTAANLWITAAIGLACAISFFTAAVVATALTLLALILPRPLEAWLYKHRMRDHLYEPHPRSEVPPEDEAP